ncbi:MAG: DUF1549 domain-containing protein, partial [Planctomycetes bacterium]|nr:DUF1549 domain-containing protein [Planctomycetota bacterium]
MCNTRRFIFTAALLLTAILSELRATEELFSGKVAPIFERSCLGCHSDSKRKGKLSMASRAALLKGGRKGPSLVPGDPAASRLIALVTAKDGKAGMPKKREPLSAAEVDVLRQWIKAGAPWPEGVVLGEKGTADFNWWSFKPLTRPAVPRLEGEGANGIRNPIDSFIRARLGSKGLKPAPEADRLTLIRRLSFDLTGLPPAPGEIDRFLSDKSPRAYEELVDRLLGSKHYGERWARHWLDVVKYADTCGYDKDKLRPNAWPYRDYVIRSF